MPIDDLPTRPLNRHPLRDAVAAFSATCFAAAFVSDVAYWRSTDFIWETFSVWALTAGLMLAAVAVLLALIAYIGDRRRGDPLTPWLQLIGCAIVIVLSILNAFVHSRDGYTAVVPTGLGLSALVLLVMIVTAAIGPAAVHRQRLGEIA